MPVTQLNGSLNMSWKKSLSVTSQEKKSLFLIKEKKNVTFSFWKKKKLIRKKNHTLPLVLNGSSLIWFGPWECRLLRLNPSILKLFNCNFHPLGVAPRWRDPQLQVSKYYLELTKWRSKIFKYCWFLTFYRQQVCQLICNMLEIYVKRECNRSRGRSADNV